MIEKENFASKPCLLGGKPVFPRQIGVVRPTLPEMGAIKERIADVLKRKILSNDARYVRRLEAEVRNYLRISHCAAVCNGTLGLILALEVLGLREEVIVPSFTFSATVHSLLWNKLKPRFVDIEPSTFNISLQAVEEAITSKTSAILAVHTFGNPCKVRELEQLARANKLKLIFDSAHAFGSEYQGEKVGGFGDAEVFSFHATKIIPMGEGGAVVTEDPVLHRNICLHRNFGNLGNYDCDFWGLNAKLAEIPAILGLEGLKEIEKYVRRRNEIAKIYKSRLGAIPGIYFQQIEDRCRSNYQFFSVLVKKKEFGLDRDALHNLLEGDNITTRKYFFPPVHKFDCYRRIAKDCRLPHTEYISQNILCLPIYSDMEDGVVEKICLSIKRIYENVDEIQKKLKLYKK